MKAFNKFFLFCIVLVCSVMLVIPSAFAAGEYAAVASGNESVTVTYYSDSTMLKEISSAKPGDTIYAKLTLNIPEKTFASLDLNIGLTGMTFQAENNLFTSNSEMTKFERPTDLGDYNKFTVGSTSTNISISLILGQSYSNPVNDGDYWGEKWFEYIGIDKVDLVCYTLKVNDDASGTLSVNRNSGDAGLNIGEFDDDEFWYINSTPFAFTSSPLSVGEAASKVKFNVTKDGVLTSYDVDCASDGSVSQINLPIVLPEGIEIKTMTVGTTSYTAEDVIVTSSGILFDYAVSQNEIDVVLTTDSIKDYVVGAPTFIGSFKNPEFSVETADGTVSGYAYAILANADNTPINYEYGIALASTPFSNESIPADIGYLKADVRSIDNNFAIVYVDDVPTAEKTIYYATYMKSSEGIYTFGDSGSITLTPLSK